VKPRDVTPDGQMNGWMNGWTDGWMDEWMDGRMDGRGRDGTGRRDARAITHEVHVFVPSSTAQRGAAP